MSEYLSDQEQADRVIKLVKKHGYNVLIVVMLGLTAYYGYQYWINKTKSENALAINQLTEINQKKQQMSMASLQGKPVPKGDVTAFLAGVDELVKKNPNTLFSQQALLHKAQYYVGENQLDKALIALQSAKKEYTKDKGLTALINTRIAKVLIANNKAKEAINILKSINLEAYAFTTQELLGDAYVAENQNEEAKTAYLKAWGLKEDLAEKQVLALKMESIGVLPPAENATASAQPDEMSIDESKNSQSVDLEVQSAEPQALEAQDSNEQASVKKDTAQQDTAQKNLADDSGEEKPTADEDNKTENSQTDENQTMESDANANS